MRLILQSPVFQRMPKFPLEPVLGAGCTLCFQTWEDFLAREVHTPKSREACVMPSPALSTFILRQFALPFVGPASTSECLEQLPPAPRGTKRFDRSRDLFGRIDWQGATDNRRKSAWRAWYVAADRLRSEPRMTITPSLVETDHLHARPRLRTVVSRARN
jgi:hypothetical protein